MKKVALSLLAFALVGAIAFGDDMAPVTKVTGYLDTGVFVTTSSNGNTFLAKGNDAGANGYRAKVTAAQSAANYGVSITLEKDANAALTLDGATAWVVPMDGVKLSGGTDYTGDVNGIDDKGIGIGSAGVIAAEYSTGGITAAVTVNAPSAAAGSGTAIGFGARYTSDMVKVNFEGGLTSAQKFDGYSVSASLMAVPALTLVGGLFTTSMSTTAVTGIDLNLGYKVSDALSVGDLSYYGLTDAAVKSKSGDFTTKPNATFKLDPKTTLSGYVLYESTKNSNIEPQAQVSLALPNTTLNAAVQYDTNPGNLGTAVATTTLWVELLYSF